MHGDFSRWDRGGTPNLSAVLHQQGRVLLDRDWNDQARLTTGWQDEAARDVIGAGVAAVGSRQPDSFRVDAVRVQDGQVIVSLHPGAVWADGIPVRLEGDRATPVDRTAAYLDASVQASPGCVGTIAEGVRDVVVLEVWRETLSAFQVPGELLEAALGGPDTTARALTAFRLRLARLDSPWQDCHSVSPLDLPRGRLRVSLRPTTTVPGDCPVVDEGGYVGFEHQLYRVEVAEADDAGAFFKWSRFNGGLVGRATVHLGDPASERFTLAANDQAIRTAGQTDFYLEVLELDDLLGFWRVTYGADVTLDGDDLRVVSARFNAASPPADTGAGDSGVFFRLWDGRGEAGNFPAAVDPAELEAGIRLEFPDPAERYRPGDFWTFAVRAGGLPSPGEKDDGTLLDDAAPHGIRYHRVPLAEVTWLDLEAEPPATAEIEDCRTIFRPLTDQDCCCTLTVGDGVHSHGDFDRLEDAVRHLPAHGGKICVLPGDHRANVRILGRVDVEVSGCGEHSRVMPRPGQELEPLFLIARSRGVRLHGLSLVTSTGTAVRVDDDAEFGGNEDPDRPRGPSAELAVEHNRILAGVHAVEARPDNSVGGDNDIRIRHNQVALLDTAAGRAALLVSADRVLIERNRVVVVPPYDADDRADPRPPGTPRDPTFEPCDRRGIYAAAFPARLYLKSIFIYVTSVGFAPRARYRALGGIQVCGGSERVRILENEVVGGAGHGITLGEVPAPGEEEQNLPAASFFVTELPAARQGVLQRLMPPLYDVEIDANVIRDMGMCGIGVAAFFHPEQGGVMVRVEGLAVTRNRIERCVRDPVAIPDPLRAYAALGGVALADCAAAVFRENLVEENGGSTLQPVCGIFVLRGERVEFAENVVQRNGRAAGGSARLHPGWRAGIALPCGLDELFETLQEGDPRHGLPAVWVHGNRVAQPAGHALIVGAVGPVSVQGNSLAALNPDSGAAPLAALAATVLIVDLGVSVDSVVEGFANRDREEENEAADIAEFLGSVVRIPPGGVLFADNQVRLDLRDPEAFSAICSVLVLSLDDVGFADNQLECASALRATPRRLVAGDSVLADALLAGGTVRCGGNRFEEGVTLTVYSLAALGTMNTVTMNQSTHCLYVSPARRVVFGNQVWRPTAGALGRNVNCGDRL